MPFIILFTIIALGLPYLMASFFEWTFDPSAWGWYTRGVLAVLYLIFGGYLLPLLLQMARRFDQLSNRKRDGDWQ